MKNLWKSDSTHDRIAIIIWDYDTIWLSVILKVLYLWLIEFASLMTLFYIDLQSAITNHSIYLDPILSDILWFNISNLRRWYIYIYIYIWALWSSSYTRYLIKKKTSGINFQIVSSTLIFILQVWIVNLFLKLYNEIWWLNIISGLKG